MSEIDINDVDFSLGSTKYLDENTSLIKKNELLQKQLSEAKNALQEIHDYAEVDKNFLIMGVATRILKHLTK